MFDAERESTSIQSMLERILRDYAQVTSKTVTSQYPYINDLFEELDTRLKSLGIEEHSHVKVKWSIGKGFAAKVPWIAFLDTRETMTTQEGVFCVFFFRSDQKGVYLTFTQGVKKIKEQYGKTQAWEKLRLRATTELRKYCEDLQQCNFELDVAMDLAVCNDPKGYENATVAHKLYLKGQIPEDKAIIQDLDRILQSYEKYMAKGAGWR